MFIRATAIALCGAIAAVAPADVIEIQADRDNTLYESASGALSNGAGQFLFAGMNNQGEIRRALLHFDVASALPANAMIESVSMTLNVSALNSGPADMSMHRMLADWGEGASNAGVPGGQGAPAMPGDATWLHSFFPGTTWATPGGDFAATASAVVSSPFFGPLTWASTPELVADVQGWLDAPETNFGWAVLGDETTPQSARRFDSRESPTAANRPKLLVEYSIVPAPGALALLGLAGLTGRRRRR